MAKAPAGRARISGPRASGRPVADRLLQPINQITLTPPRKPSSGDLAGFGAGLLAYVLVLNYIRDGSDGVKGWFSAKFLNKPMAAPAPDVTKPASAASNDLTTTRPSVATL